MSIDKTRGPSNPLKKLAALGKGISGFLSKATPGKSEKSKATHVKAEKNNSKPIHSRHSAQGSSATPKAESLTPKELKNLEKQQLESAKKLLDRAKHEAQSSVNPDHPHIQLAEIFKQETNPEGITLGQLTDLAQKGQPSIEDAKIISTTLKTIASSQTTTSFRPQDFHPQADLALNLLCRLAESDSSVPEVKDLSNSWLKLMSRNPQMTSTITNIRDQIRSANSANSKPAAATTPLSTEQYVQQVAKEIRQNDRLSPKDQIFQQFANAVTSNESQRPSNTQSLPIPPRPQQRPAAPQAHTARAPLRPAPNTKPLPVPPRPTRPSQTSARPAPQMASSPANATPAQQTIAKIVDNNISPREAKKFIDDTKNQIIRHAKTTDYKPANDENLTTLLTLVYYPKSPVKQEALNALNDLIQSRKVNAETMLYIMNIMNSRP